MSIRPSNSTLKAQLDMLRATKQPSIDIPTERLTTLIEELLEYRSIPQRRLDDEALATAITDLYCRLRLDHAPNICAMRMLISVLKLARGTGVTLEEITDKLLPHTYRD